MRTCPQPWHCQLPCRPSLPGPLLPSALTGATAKSPLPTAGCSHRRASKKLWTSGLPTESLSHGLLIPPVLIPHHLHPHPRSMNSGKSTRQQQHRMVQPLMRSGPRMAQVTQTQGRQQGREAAHCPRGDNVSGKDKFQSEPVTGSAEVPADHQCHLAHESFSSLRCWSLVCEISSCQWVRMRDFGLGQGFRSTQSEQS